MTLNELLSSDAVFVNANDIAPILNARPQEIRNQAKADASVLGFPVIVINKRVRVPRVPFLRWIGMDV